MINVDLKTDGHIHTMFCHHAVGEMEDYVKAGIHNGLDSIIFLEHLEAGIDYFESTWLSSYDFERYFEIGRELQKRYKDQINLGIGVEVGYNPDRIEEIKEFLKRHNWDRIGLSYHFFAEDGRHLNMLSKKKVNMLEFSKLGLERVVSRYFIGLLEAVKQLPITVICHLDAVLRHHPELKFTDGHKQQICTILSEMTGRGISLEINTSGIKHRNQPYPESWIVKKAIGLNIPLVAGSDAHRPQDVGQYFDRLQDYYV